ncbi:ATPase [Streptomyces mashuensis]|uniref:ATPase n=1 Tax=Streptomyces mashuensis TaxID=33904 RepID=A0A919B9Q2_9ACTN|nr:ATP-binding protein [Streptomyces mashuensis]GHF70047.1 ATPase [Streptomyces mashuensis]
MISRGNKHCAVELQALPPRIGQVRRIVSAQLRYWHLDPLIEPAALGVTELLTNVHQHAQPDKRCTVEMDVELDAVPARLTVSVRDHDPRPPRVPEAGPDSAESTHGRGLALVAAVSSSWGVRESHDGGKVVWFTLTVPATAPASARRPVRRAEPVVAFGRPAPVRPALAEEPALAGSPARAVREPVREPVRTRSAVPG